MRRALAILLALVLLCACGPTPPQAPLPYAKRLDSATSGISTTCGEAYQMDAFQQPSLATLEVTASSSVAKLVSVYQRNPNWIYQGETVRDIVADSYAMLSSCGLHDARDKLRRETAPR